MSFTTSCFTTSAGPGSRPGRTHGDDTSIQRDRPDPGHPLFGQATSRTRRHPSLEHQPQLPLDIKGSQKSASVTRASRRSAWRSKHDSEPVPGCTSSPGAASPAGVRSRASTTAAGDSGTSGRWTRSTASGGILADDCAEAAARERSRASPRRGSRCRLSVRSSAPPIACRPILGLRRHTAGDGLPAVCHVVSARPAFGLLEAACGAVQLP